MASKSKGPICLRLLMEDSILVRDQEGVTLVDTESMQSLQIIKS